MKSGGEEDAAARNGQENGRGGVDAHRVGGELEEAELVMDVKGRAMKLLEWSLTLDLMENGIKGQPERNA